MLGIFSDFKVFKPNFRDFWFDITDYRDFSNCMDFRDCTVFKDFRLDFINFRSDFRTFVHWISEEVCPSGNAIGLFISQNLLLSTASIRVLYPGDMSYRYIDFSL